jgi:hypothetical protein
MMSSEEVPTDAIPPKFDVGEKVQGPGRTIYTVKSRKWALKMWS